MSDIAAKFRAFLENLGDNYDEGVTIEADDARAMLAEINGLTITCRGYEGVISEQQAEIERMQKLCYQKARLIEVLRDALARKGEGE